MLLSRRSAWQMSAMRRGGCQHRKGVPEPEACTSRESEKKR